MTFIPLDASLRPFGAPPSKGRRENTDSQTPHTDGFRYENAASPHSSFRAKARHLFRSREGKGCERNGKREAPCSLRPEKRCFMQTAPRRKKNTANEKDPSATLGMTIRECRFARIRHFERKRENLFRSWEGKGCERNSKRETPYSLRPPKDGVSCRPFHTGKGTRQTKKIPRLRSG